MSMNYYVVGVRGENYRASIGCEDAETAFSCFDSETKNAIEKGGPTLWVLLEDRDGKTSCLKSIARRMSQATQKLWVNFREMVESALGKGRYGDLCLIPEDMIL